MGELLYDRGGSQFGGALLQNVYIFIFSVKENLKI